MRRRRTKNDRQQNLLSFPHSWLITWLVTRVTQRMPHVEQELLSLPGHFSSLPVFNEVRVARSLVAYIVFCISLFVLLTNKLSVILRSTTSDYHFGIFKQIIWMTLPSPETRCYQCMSPSHGCCLEFLCYSWMDSRAVTVKVAKRSWTI
jgi:hypothetical protein